MLRHLRKLTGSLPLMARSETEFERELRYLAPWLTDGNLQWVREQAIDIAATTVVPAHEIARAIRYGVLAGDRPLQDVVFSVRLSCDIRTEGQLPRS